MMERFNVSEVLRVGRDMQPPLVAPGGQGLDKPSQGVVVKVGGMMAFFDSLIM